MRHVLSHCKQVLPCRANPFKQLVQTTVELQVPHPTGQSTGTPPTTALARLGLGLAKHDPLIRENPVMHMVQLAEEVQVLQLVPHEEQLPAFK